MPVTETLGNASTEIGSNLPELTVSELSAELKRTVEGTFPHVRLRGEISNRWGLANRAGGIANAVATGAQLVLCGHDHQAAADCVDLNGKRMVVACASTLTTRVRGGGPGAINVLEIDDQSIQVSVMKWSDESKSFVRSIWSKFSRSV